LVALVLQEPGPGIDIEIEAIRARVAVAAGDVPPRDSVAEGDQAARLVGALGLGVLDERRADAGRDHHQRRSSIDSAPSVQKSAERYFQPPSASTQTIVPSSSPPASGRATWGTAPGETPAKMPSRSRRSRTPAMDSSLETRIFR